MRLGIIGPALAMAFLSACFAVWVTATFMDWAQDIAETHRLAVPILSALLSSLLCGIGWKRWRAAQASEKRPR